MSLWNFILRFCERCWYSNHFIANVKYVHVGNQVRSEFMFYELALPACWITLRWTSLNSSLTSINCFWILTIVSFHDWTFNTYLFRIGLLPLYLILYIHIYHILVILKCSKCLIIYTIDSLKVRTDIYIYVFTKYVCICHIMCFLLLNNDIWEHTFKVYLLR